MDQYTVELPSGLRGVLQKGGQRGVAIISHGAGSGLDTPLLISTAQRLTAAGFTTLRWNFGYLDEGRAPSSGSKREKRELNEVIDFIASRGPIILVGKSFGARVSSYVAAERQDVRALVFYGLPLHGLGKNAKPRDWSHLALIKAPMLFITGDRDRLCSLDHLAEVQKVLTAPYESCVVPGDHSFKPRGQDAAVDTCVRWLQEHF